MSSTTRRAHDDDENGGSQEQKKRGQVACRACSVTTNIWAASSATRTYASSGRRQWGMENQGRCRRLWQRRGCNSEAKVWVSNLLYPCRYLAVLTVFYMKDGHKWHCSTDTGRKEDVFRTWIWSLQRSFIFTLPSSIWAGTLYDCYVYWTGSLSVVLP